MSGILPHSVVDRDCLRPRQERMLKHDLPQRVDVLRARFHLEEQVVLESGGAPHHEDGRHAGRPSIEGGRWQTVSTADSHHPSEECDGTRPEEFGLDGVADMRVARPTDPPLQRLVATKPAKSRRQVVLVRHVPVRAWLTGYGPEWICAAAFKLGVADYLQKPVNAVDLLAAVWRALSLSLDRGESPSESPILRGLPAPLSTPIQRAMGLIQQRYWDQFSLSALAHQVGMSKYHLSHRFREMLGITFRDYLLRVRLERAKALLSAGHVSITEVAQNVGFGDLARFDKVFKRYTGVTPSAYRSLAQSPSKK